ncbi:unnamed protein product, partial [Durusdinium trenchii]
ILWKHGVGVMSHVGALDPELVANVDPEAALKWLEPHFQYLDTQEVWGLTIKLVQQLDIAVENLHLSGCACLLKIAWGAKSDASDSDASASASTAKRSVTKESWYMLGCGSKRPLVHIMGMMDEKCITICSVRKMAL